MKFFLVLAVSVLTFGSDAIAQSHLREAEAAYGEIDFERALEEASAALEEGGYDPRDLARIYELIGMAAAANGEEERSRDAYIRLLALTPEAEVDTNLAPRLRSPFMEAKGYWASRSDVLGVEARFVEARHLLRVELVDPLGMATDVIVRSRAAGTAEYTEHNDVASASTTVPLPEVSQIEYVVEVLDENGNQVAVLGSEDEPMIGGDAATALGPVEGEVESSGVPVWVWVGLGVVAVGAAATGLYLGLRRQPITLDSAVTF
ncbi:MAG: hypothetical protein ACI9KE_003026 [Polyangiales bacterium]|jgi:hypothetical protein